LYIRVILNDRVINSQGQTTSYRIRSKKEQRSSTIGSHCLFQDPHEFFPGVQADFRQVVSWRLNFSTE